MVTQTGVDIFRVGFRVDRKNNNFIRHIIVDRNGVDAAYRFDFLADALY